MNTDNSESLSALDDPRVFEAVQEYMAALETGKRPNKEAFLARHADIAAALTDCLAGLDIVHSAGPRLRTTSAATLSGPETPNPLGDFRIVREIGRGGMGIVYEAVQLSLGRSVALKVLPFAAAFDERHLQRFRNEAHAAAQLHHTNIVPVHAVGCERGLHYYAMQLIEGQSLALIIRRLRQDGEVREATSGVSTSNAVTAPAQRELESPPLPDETAELTARLTTQRTNRRADFCRSAVRLILQAAEALEHAHQFGVVHRDIKPANLLVDARGRLWVADFGLAQLAAEAGLTETGDILGTLRYMSPEQASGRRGAVDHRTDVYSLGATLYELLTLQPAHPGRDRQRLLHQLLNEEPRSPRALDRRIPVELETIVLKAIAKSPADRYDSAGAFAADLQRFLDDKPILARRPGPIDLARKWMRRHPGVVASTLVAAVLTAIILLIGNRRISDQKDQTAYALKQEKLRAAEAEARFQLARRSVDELIQLAEQEMADQTHLTSLRRRMLEVALAYYQEFIELRRDDLDAAAELAQTRDRVQSLLSELAVLQGAGQLYLLNENAVLDDLRPTADQRSRLSDVLRRLVAQRDESFREFHRMTSDERRQRFVDLARANEAEVAIILRPEQITRLGQIALQLKGPMAFREPDVLTKLKLTNDQRDRLRGIETDVFVFKMDWPRGGPSMGGPFGGGPFRKRDEPGPLKGTMDRMLAVLTEEQKQIWKEMIGAPFKGDLRPNRFGPGPGGGPPGPGGREGKGFGPPM